MNDFVTSFGWFAAGAFAMLLFLLFLGERRDASQDRREVPAEPVVLPQPLDLWPEPVAAAEVAQEPTVEPAETVVPMEVIPPWPKLVEEPEPVPVAWRRRAELEAAPMFGGLPAHESVWRFDGWNLDDPDRTQMMRIIDGVDADDLDMDLGEPKPLRGFEVDPAARRGLSLSEELIADVTTSRRKAEVSA